MVAIGGATAIDTLCAQESRPKSRAKYLYQTLSILGILYLAVIVPLWVSSGKIFKEVFGQEEAFAEETGKFMKRMIFAGALQVVNECLKKFLQVQGASYAVGMAVMGASAVGIGAMLILTLWTRLAFVGIPLGFTIYQLCIILALVATLLSKGDIRKSLKVGSGCNILKDLRRPIAYSLSGVLTIATEWWSFEILALLAAQLGPESIGAQSILMSSDLILTTMSLGLGVALSHAVGHCLGAGDGMDARKVIISGNVLASIIGGVECVAIVLLRDYFGYLFTEQKGVVAAASRVLPMMALFQVLDLANGASGGALRGAGKNHWSGLSNFLGYYGVGLVSAYLLCFHAKMGLFGLWLGIISGSAALLVLQTLCICLLNWNRLAQVVSGRQRIDASATNTGEGLG